MPIHITLDASAIRELINLDEEPMLELRTKATEQVAQALARRLTHEVIEEKVRQIVDGLVVEGGRYRPQLTDSARGQVTRLLQESIGSYLAKLSDDTLRSSVRKIAQEEVTLLMGDFTIKIKNIADQILRERFGRMFALPSDRVGNLSEPGED